MRRAGFIGAVALAAIAPAVSRAHSSSKTSKGAVVRWLQKAITVEVDASSPSRYLPDAVVREAISDAGAVWSVLPESRIVFRKPDPAVPPLARIRFIGRGWSDRTDRFAVTRVRADENTGTAESATIDVNEERYEMTQQDLQVVLVHEFGHVLGLGHSTAGAAVMYETSTLEPRRNVPTEDDRRGLAAIYGSVQIRPLPVARAPMMTLKVTEGRLDLTACVRSTAGDGFLVGPCPEVPASMAKPKK